MDPHHCRSTKLNNMCLCSSKQLFSLPSLLSVVLLLPIHPFHFKSYVAAKTYKKLFISSKKRNWRMGEEEKRAGRILSWKEGNWRWYSIKTVERKEGRKEAFSSSPHLTFCYCYARFNLAEVGDDENFKTCLGFLSWKRRELSELRRRDKKRETIYHLS